MKLSNIKDVVDDIRKHLLAFKKDPLHPTFKRDLLAIFDDYPSHTERRLSRAEISKINAHIKEETRFADKLASIYDGGVSLEQSLNVEQMKKLETVFSDRKTGLMNYLDSAPTRLNYVWIKLGNIYSRHLGNKTTLNVLMPDHLITIAYMDGPFINFVVEKIKSLIFFHLTMPSESTEDMRQWDIVVEQWIEGILSDASWSNQQLSSLYWSRVETAYFIDLILSLRCRANSEFRLHTMHCVVFWFCHVSVRKGCLASDPWGITVF